MAETDILSLAKVLGAKNLTNNPFASNPMAQNYLTQRGRAQSAEEQLQATKTPLGALSSGIALYMQRKQENKALGELNEQMKAQEAAREEKRLNLINSLPENERVGADFLDYDTLAKVQADRLKPKDSVDMPSNVREFQYFSRLDPEEQQNYLDVKRANPYESAREKEKGKGVGQAEVNLGNVMDKSDYLLEKINELKSSKGLKDVVGVKGGGAFLQNFGIDKIVPGTKAADFKARLDQIGGQTFLQAYDTLKGGGHITEIEGEKATNAIARMKSAVSEEAFLEAANDFKKVIETARKRAIKQAKGELGEPIKPNEGNNQDLSNQKDKKLQNLKDKYGL